MKDDTISRSAAIDAVECITSSMSVCINEDECHGMKRMQRQAVLELANMPSAQPEITDEQAIEHLQSTGWMQNHDREMYYMGLKKQLADDSGSYDSLLPSTQPEKIRCKDCKHFAREGMYCSCDIIDRFDHFYCYYAERKEDD